MLRFDGNLNVTLKIYYRFKLPSKFLLHKSTSIQNNNYFNLNYGKKIITDLYPSPHKYNYLKICVRFQVFGSV